MRRFCAVALGRVQLAGLGQETPRLVELAKQAKRSTVATQRTGALGPPAQLFVDLAHARSDGRRLGRHVQLQVRIDHLELGVRRAVRDL